MGNTQTSRLTSTVQPIELTNTFELPLSTLKISASRISAICYADKLNAVFVAYKMSKKVHKVNLCTKKLEDTYRFNETNIKFIALNKAQNRLYICDQNSLRLVDTERNTLMTILFSYQPEDHINIVRMFNYRYIVISLLYSKLFEVFDVKTGVKEGLVYNKSSGGDLINFTSFNCSHDNEFLILLDHDYIYLFNLQTMKELNRVYHKGKDSEILHVARDNKRLYMLSDGYITLRKLKSLAKVKSFKFRRFAGSESIIFMRDERAIVIVEKEDISFINPDNLEIICALKQPDLQFSCLSPSNRHLVTIDQKKILIYAFNGQLEESKLGLLHTTTKNKRTSKKKAKIDFTDHYRLIGNLVKENRIDAALTECRQIIRQSEEEHKGYFVTGKLLALKCYYDESLEFMNQAIYLSSRAVATYFIWRGKVLYYMQRYQEALDSFNRALILDPEKASAANNIETVKKRIKAMKNSMVVASKLSYPSYPTEMEANTGNAFDYENMFDRAFLKAKSEESVQQGQMTISTGTKAKSEPKPSNNGETTESGGFNFLEFQRPFVSKNLSDEDKASYSVTELQASMENGDKVVRPFINKSYARFVNTEDELSLESNDEEFTGLAYEYSNTVQTRRESGDVNNIGYRTSEEYEDDIPPNKPEMKNIESKGEEVYFDESETFQLTYPTRDKEALKYI